MRIINKIAVEPESLSSWAVFRYVMEKLSFSNGLVLTKFPKSWPKILLEKLDVGDIERQKIVTKLQAYKNDRMVSSGMAYKPGLSWMDNILERIGEHDVERVLVSDKSTIYSDSDIISTPVDADEEFFEVPREVNTLNTSEGLCDVAEVLLSNATIAIFVDPYFSITRSSSYLESLGEFACVASSYGRCEEFVIYAHSNQVPHEEGKEVDRAFDKYIQPKVKPRFKITVRYLDDLLSEHPLHARYLVTDKGGLRYDKGFRPGRPPVFVDISLLDTSMYRLIFERFSDPINEYQIVLEHKWIS